ncbi:MAG TPA: hypothetical protein PLD40_09730 [Kiritimatiellia bacterium]|jgi:hypothetical protein|nr:hypothetical protein [Kiritimatiellia bacterium]HOR75104.1 hypothetical protein [Kiritimatiellia bacterium]HOU59643.1 hypothetical protein [Kiritimatiellia bacterium]HPK70074.1 hypothetical protein [Kiritimatiellia bacterium]HPV47846.1 hypothetical protein [Kiritimatiellia bacterium]
MRKTTTQIWLAIIATGLIFNAAQAQTYGVQPSPAYHQAQPTYFMPAPSARPAVEADDDYADEEGIYWFWGQKWPGLSLGPKFGTTGIGADLTFGINQYLNLRGGFNYGAFTWKTKLGSTKYDMDVDMVTAPILLDIHPLGGHFHLTAGLYIQPDVAADIKATPTSNKQIGEHTYPPEVIGTLRGEVEAKNAVAPYLGIGFGNTVGEDQLLTLHLDIGVIFQSYDASLTSDGEGMTAKLDTFREDLKKEESNIQHDLNKLGIFPVVTLGIAWHF